MCLIRGTFKKMIADVFPFFQFNGIILVFIDHFKHVAYVIVNDLSGDLYIYEGKFTVFSYEPTLFHINFIGA
jgi:hypothetical protein